MDKITLRDKEYPCRITMGAMVRYKRESGHDVSKMDTTDICALLLFLYCCTASASASDGVEFNYTFDQFADQMEPEMLNRFCEGLVVSGTEKKTKRPAPAK